MTFDKRVVEGAAQIDAEDDSQALREVLHSTLCDYIAKGQFAAVDDYMQQQNTLPKRCFASWLVLHYHDHGAVVDMFYRKNLKQYAWDVADAYLDYLKEAMW